MGFLLSFTDKFIVAFELWPAASFVLTLPILAHLYHREGRLRFWSAAGAYLIVLYFLGLGCFTLYPLPAGDAGLGITYGIAPQLDPLAFIADIRKDGITAVLQIVMNIIFFMPLGFICTRAFGMRLRSTAALGLVISLLIETAQLTGLFWLYPHAYRTFDVNDLMWNAGGAVIGWWAAEALARVLPPVERDEGGVTTAPGFVRRGVAFSLDMLLVWAATLLIWSLATLVLPDGARRSLAEGPCLDVLPVAMFLLVEFAVPLARDGRTPGGAFVRMTCETRERPPAGSCSSRCAWPACGPPLPSLRSQFLCSPCSSWSFAACRTISSDAPPPRRRCAIIGGWVTEFERSCT